MLGVCLGAVVAAGGQVSAAEPEKDGRVSSRSAQFDIAEQPLADALEAFGRVTGMAALVDHSLVTGRVSPGVRGTLPADQALKILLAGTGLFPHFVSGQAFTLAPSGGGSGTDAPTSGERRSGTDFRIYFADLQETLIRVLCQTPETRPGESRLGLQLWIGPEGQVLASHLLDPTASERRAAAITELLRSNTLVAPPADLPLPITVVLLPRSPGQASECGGDGRPPR